MKSRIAWLDIAKALGMFFIYVGHFATAAGKLYPFVFTFHVPMFFFLAGCSEWLSKPESFDRFLLKAVKALLIPMFLFSFASMVTNFVLCRMTGKVFDWASSLHHIFNGNIRVHFYAASLWFLSCLFVMKLVFYFLRRYLRLRPILLAVCLGLFYVANTVLPNSPVVAPSWAYNVDSMLYYIIYYCLGYCLMEPIQKLLAPASGKKWRSAVIYGLLAVLSVYAVMLYLGTNLLAFLYIPGKLAMIYDLVIPVVLTIWVILVSHMLRKIKPLSLLGRDSLYLCGSEYIIKIAFAAAFGILGWQEPVSTPLHTAGYTLLILLVCWLTLVPIERFLFRKMKIA